MFDSIAATSLLTEMPIFHFIASDVKVAFKKEKGSIKNVRKKKHKAGLQKKKIQFLVFEMCSCDLKISTNHPPSVEIRAHTHTLDLI